MANFSLRVKVDKIGDFNPVVREVKKAMQKEMDVIERMFGKATSTWSAKNKPVWKRTLLARGDAFKARMSTNSTPFTYIETGTKTRWAKMDPRFMPKSTPRSFTAKAGAFPTPLTRGKRNMKRAKPGIKARKWREEVSKRREKQIKVKVNLAIQKGLRRMTK